MENVWNYPFTKEKFVDAKECYVVFYRNVRKVTIRKTCICEPCLKYSYVLVDGYGLYELNDYGTTWSFNRNDIAKYDNDEEEKSFKKYRKNR